MSAGPTCSRLIRTVGGGLRYCGGELRQWRGTDGHNGSETFTTCKKCGATR